MPVLYKPYQSVLKNKEGKKLFYPRPMMLGNVGISQIAREIAGYSSLTAGDVKNTIENLVTVMTRYLQASQSVTLEGFGTFSMGIRARGKGVEKAEDVSAAKATLHIRFLPASTRNPDRSLATRSMVTGVKCLRYDSLEGAASLKPNAGGSPGSNPGTTPGGEAPDPAA